MEGLSNDGNESRDRLTNSFPEGVLPWSGTSREISGQWI
jgi:hypothetical protein